MEGGRQRGGLHRHKPVDDEMVDVLVPEQHQLSRPAIAIHGHAPMPACAGGESALLALASCRPAAPSWVERARRRLPVLLIAGFSAAGRWQASGPTTGGSSRRPPEPPLTRIGRSSRTITPVQAILLIVHGEMGKFFPMHIARLPHAHLVD